ncbi:branched-chain alpha-keto acid dehydrogenase subunit E2 [Pseudomonas oryzihabitans]|uniref:flagellar filament capping protein FliD n=1 Tax=Pseudomonas oryzihabitans TaxID=47885 RepID=UPI0007367417|nr:flagellar filament capping protein FliD [Pseudomonas psychrotolerans]KTT54135.1 branched-chain alpha-keto acid dehydrogenase subunit E2 [Pseudomonas psychrotolerans]
MAGISGIGGSGLDIDSIVTKMVAAEKAPKQDQLNATQTKATAQLTAIGSLKGAISEFQTALTTLNSPTSFQARAVTLSKSDYLTATASTSASIGSYQVAVTQLAGSSKVALASVPATSSTTGSDGKASTSPTTFGKGTLSIKVGDTKLSDIKVDATNNTLSGIRDAINKAGQSQGISASVVNDDTGSRLVLSSTKTGDGNDISVAVSGDDGSGKQSLTKLAYTPSGTDSTDPAAAHSLTKAKSAQMTIDGLKVTSASNTVSNAVDGLSFTLKATTPADSPMTVGVSQDESGVKGNVQKFVDAYNKLMGVIKTQTSVTKVGDNSAPITAALVGDATARGLTTTIRSELGTMQGTGAVKALADLGITTQKDGTLAIDDTKLSTMVSSNFSDLSGFFTGDQGLAARLKGKLDPYTMANGILEQRSNSLSTTLKNVDAQTATLNTRMTALSDRLYKQYNAMDQLYSSLSTTASSLSQQLAAMPFANKS